MVFYLLSPITILPLGHLTAIKLPNGNMIFINQVKDLKTVTITKTMCNTITVLFQILILFSLTEFLHAQKTFTAQDCSSLLF